MVIYAQLFGYMPLCCDDQLRCGSGTEGRGRITTFCPEYRACLHGGGGSQVGEVTRLGGVMSVHIISYFFLIMFTIRRMTRVSRWGNPPTLGRVHGKKLKRSKAKHVCFKTLYISQPFRGRNHQKQQRTHNKCKMFIFRNV